LAYPPYSPNLAPCDSWLFAHVKEQLWSKWFEWEVDINTAVTNSLYCLSKNEYRATTDYMPHRLGKGLYSAGNYSEYRTYV
jgi:hypothetical protein